MPSDLLDRVKAILNNRRSKGAENIGSSLFVSMVNARSQNRSLLAPVAPANVPHDINPAGSLLGMDNFESGSSSQFVSWINGNGLFVPQPLLDAVPQVAVVSDWCDGLTDEMFGKEYLESRSSHFGAYPSPCIVPVNDLPLLDDGFSPLSHAMDDSRHSLTVDPRDARLDKALAFQKVFTKRSSTNEKGTCIWSDGTHPWSGKSCGIRWVAVHGMHSICVVTRNEDLVREVSECIRALDFSRSKEFFLEVFMQGIIYKVEDLAKQIFGESCKKPFGVVSVIPGTHEGSGHEASSGAEYDEEKAIKFLQDEMKRNTAFTFDKTVQTAISAFQHLFRQKFKADEIRVIVWKEDGDIVKELPSRDDRSIEEHVAVVRAR